MRRRDEPVLLDHPLPLTELDTPCLLLDDARLRANVERLRARLSGLGVRLRPHLKTAKSIDVARMVMDTPAGPATVSTLKEAEYFAAHGVTDLLYAVGIAPSKLARVAALRARGVDLAVVLDSVEAARAVAEKSRATPARVAGTAGLTGVTGGRCAADAREAIPALIEIDCDGHRSGVQPHETERLLAIARALHEGGAELRGIVTHAGESYNARGLAALQRMAEAERAAAVRCATVLREAGLPCPVVSVGSTPTAHVATTLDGVTEVRAGVFTFFDLVMAGVGVCRPDDVALSVLATVIGHQAAKGWIITDAGWMALSRDRGTSRWSGAPTASGVHPAGVLPAGTPARAAAAGTEALDRSAAPAAASADAGAAATFYEGYAIDQGYGMVCDLDGRPYPDLIVKDANQEHGILALRAGSGAARPDLPLGTLVRILPNHACATAAQHDRYHVLTHDARAVWAEWPRVNGW